MGIDESIRDVAESQILAEQILKSKQNSLLSLRGYFIESVDSFNNNKRNEFVIVDWSADTIYGTSDIVINIECLKNRSDNSYLNEESYGDEDFEEMIRKLKRIIREKTGKNVEVSVNSSYYGK